MATKPSTARSKTAKPAAPAPEAQDPAPAVEAKEAGSLRIKGLIDRIAEKTDVRKKDLRGVVEVALAEIGAALDRGEGLNLPGLGHMRVARKGDNGAMTVKLRRPDPKGSKEKAEKGEDGAKEALAAAGEAE